VYLALPLYHRRAADAVLARGVPAMREPRPHQITGVLWLLAALGRQSRAILADGMGLGKTLQSLIVAHTLGSRVLFVTPLAAQATWIGSAQQDFPSQPIQVIADSVVGVDEAIELFMKGHHWAFMSYQLFALHEATFRRHAGQRIDLVVFDEAHALCNREAQRRCAAAICPADKLLLVTIFRLAPGTQLLIITSRQLVNSDINLEQVDRSET
jgi:superfamily II DNA or RNA helicase